MLELFQILGEPEGADIFKQWEKEHPDSFAVSKYKMYRSIMRVERTWECIRQSLAVALDLFNQDGARTIFCRPEGICFEELARRRMVLFVNTSDMDRAFDQMATIFYAQALQALCLEANRSPGNRLAVPVRIIIDDFAANVKIPDFDNLISVIRSREISVSIILQSLTQLRSMYTDAQAATILNNCDHLLYLGGQDLDTAQYIGSRANKAPETILSMGLDKAYLFARGSRAKLVEKIKLFLPADAVEEGTEDEDCYCEEEDWVDELPF